MEKYCIHQEYEISMGSTMPLPCCMSKGVFRKYVKAENLIDLANDVGLNDFRRSKLSGEYKYCQECSIYKNREDRPYYFKTREEIEEIHQKPFSEIMREDGSLVEAPKRLLLGYDVSCNLACPSCRNGYIDLKDPQYKARFDIYWDSILSLKDVDKVEELQITNSGDPFGSTHFRNLIYNFPSDIMPNLKAIDFYTNGVLFTKSNYLKVSQRVRDLLRVVTISVDSADPETYEKLRGADLFKLQDNLEFIRGLKESGFIKEIEFNFVIQKENYEGLTSFMDFCQSYDADKIRFLELRNWNTVSPLEFELEDIANPRNAKHKDLLDKVQEARSVEDKYSFKVEWATSY
jgi:molybdenum cofactor biosynthesis enzyme MoaA